jgi:predicted dehydrogenase
MTQLRASVVGTGFMGWVHVEALRRVGVDVAGILGSSPEKSRSEASRLGLPRAYASFDEVLSDDTVDSVHIATPNRLHFEMAAAVLTAGKHVLCEKPLAMNSGESAQLVELARRDPHLAAGVNYNIRFYPLCLEARERVRSGAIGDVLHITGSYVQDWLLRQTDYNWRVLADEGGELRAVSDIGTHWLDLLQSITGLEVESLCADLQTVYAVRQRPTGEVQTFASDGGNVEREPVDVTTEDAGSILLRFRGGARGNLTVSQVTAGRKNCLRFEIAGSDTSLGWNSEQPNDLWIGHRDRPNEVLMRDPSLLAGRARLAASYPGGHNEGYADSFKQCFRAFYSAIEQGELAEPLFPTFADGHREIVLCEAILRSHRERCWVDVPGLSP